MTDILTLAGWTAGGVMLGLLYFRLVQSSADMLLSERRNGPWLNVTLVLLRMVGLGGMLIIAAMNGASPLLAASVGVLIGRHFVMRAVRGAV